MDFLATGGFPFRGDLWAAWFLAGVLLESFFFSFSAKVSSKEGWVRNPELNSYVIHFIEYRDCFHLPDTVVTVATAVTLLGVGDAPGGRGGCRRAGIVLQKIIMKTAKDISSSYLFVSNSLLLLHSYNFL